MCGSTGVIQRCKYARWTAFFDEITNNLVVEILDWCPFDFLSDIFLLFSLQSKLDKYLLELFVDVVDAELLEGVIL